MHKCRQWTLFRPFRSHQCSWCDRHILNAIYRPEKHFLLVDCNDIPVTKTYRIPLYHIRLLEKKRRTWQALCLRIHSRNHKQKFFLRHTALSPWVHVTCLSHQVPWWDLKGRNSVRCLQLRIDWLDFYKHAVLSLAIVFCSNLLTFLSIFSSVLLSWFIVNAIKRKI